MFGIILSILKIIGIILLILLALVLFVLCIVLFVPIRYKADGFYKESYKIEARVTWLLHIVTLRVCRSSEEALHVMLKILGLTVYDNTRPKADKKQKNKAKAAKKKKEKKTVSENKQPELKGASVESPADTQTAGDTSQVDIDTAESNSDDEKLNFWQKIIKIFRKFIHFFQNIKYTFRKFYDTIVNIKSNVSYYCNVLSQDSTKEAFQIAGKQIKRIFRNLRPRKWHVYVHLGAEDPATLGDILGIWGMLYPLHEGKIALEPDFDSEILEGEFFCKGRIHIFVYIWTAYIILFDKNIKHLKKCLLREDD